MTDKGPLLLRLFRPERLEIEDRPVSDLGFLERHADSAKVLRVRGTGPMDLRSINKLAQLEALQISSPDEPRGTLELRRFPQLRSLSCAGPVPIDWQRAPELLHLELSEPTPRDIEGIAAQRSLETLTLMAAAGVPDLPNLMELEWELVWDRDPVVGAFPALDSLTLGGPSTLEDLSGFQACGPVSWLDLSDFPALRSLRGIRLRPGAGVHLSNCPQLTDVADLDQDPEIDWDVEDCPGVEYLDP